MKHLGRLTCSFSQPSMKSRKMTPFQQNPFCSVSQGDFCYNPSPIVRLIMKLSDISKLKLKCQGNQDASVPFVSLSHIVPLSVADLSIFFSLQFRLRSHHRLRKSTGNSNTQGNTLVTPISTKKYCIVRAMKQ